MRWLGTKALNGGVFEVLLSMVKSVMFSGDRVREGRKEGGNERERERERERGYDLYSVTHTVYLVPLLQPVSEVCRSVVHTLLHMVVSLFSEDSLGDLKVRGEGERDRGG